MIQNPILPGFCPDPSIIRVGDDYYIANSSFEWWPGVKIYHSKDLKHYEQLPSPLTRMSQLNMVGEPDSCGVWAPDKVAEYIQVLPLPLMHRLQV